MLQLHLLPLISSFQSARLNNITNGPFTLKSLKIARSLINSHTSRLTKRTACQIVTCSLQTSPWITTTARPTTPVMGQWHNKSSLMNSRQLISPMRGKYQLVKATGSATSAAGTGDEISPPSNSGPHNDVTTFGENVRRPALYEASSSLAVQPIVPLGMQLQRMAPVDQAFLLLGLLACLTTGVVTAVLMTAIPALNAVRKAAVSIEKLAEVAREELPSTMAAIRLSGMEISDLTLELNDLREELSAKEFINPKKEPNSWSHEISDGVKSSARAAQAAEVGMRRMGAIAAAQTISMLQERANVPVEAVRPAMLSAAQRTRQAMELTQKMVVTLISHPRLAGWLGQLAAKKEEEKVSPEVIKAIATEIDAATEALGPPVGDSKPLNESNTKTSDAASVGGNQPATENP